MRLDKFLADAGLGTRSEVKKLIKKNIVKINGAAAKDPSAVVMPEKDVVEVNGEAIVLDTGLHWFLLHKPAGYVTATGDGRFPTVMDLLPADLRGYFPVGRLDKDTEGLLLITNDGATAHHMLSPRHHVPKTYLALLDVPATQDDATAFAEGIDIGDDKPTAPAKLELPAREAIAHHLREGLPEGHLALLTLTEGRYHQVKRMFAARGKTVVYLKRLSFGDYSLPEGLAVGEWVRIS